MLQLLILLSISKLMETTKYKKFKAFLSYSHASDAKLAPALQTGLRKFNKPLLRVRNFRVFRDETNLGVSPGLWPNIENALDNSEYFLLLASPDSAKSKWVQKEIDSWLIKNSPTKILILLTDGNIEWDNTTDSDFDWSKTTALPSNLKGKFVYEPHWIDFRNLRKEKQLNLGHPHFRDNIAGIVSVLQGKDKDELIGEDISKHRISIMILISVIIILIVLFILSIFYWLMAVNNRRTAEKNEKEAISQAKCALSRQLAAQSLSINKQQLDLSILLSVEAIKAYDTIEARGALLSCLLFNPRLLTYLHAHKDYLLNCIFSTNGELMASKGNDGFILWDAVNFREIRHLQKIKNEYTMKALSSDGKVLVLYDKRLKSILLWNISSNSMIAEPFESYEACALSPDGKSIAMGNTNGEVIQFHIPSEKTIGYLPTIFQDSGISKLAYDNVGRMLACVSNNGGISVWDLTRHSCIGRLSFAHAELPVQLSFSKDDRKLIIKSPELVTIWEILSMRKLQQFRLSRKAMNPDGLPGELRISYNQEGTILAIGDQRGITLFDVIKNKPLGQSFNGQKGTVSILLINPDGKTLVSWSGPNMGAFQDNVNDFRILIWRLNDKSRIFRRFNAHKGGVLSLSFSADGKSLASAGCDNRILLWSTNTDKPYCRLLAKHRAEEIRFCPNGLLLVSDAGGDSGPILWDIMKMKQIRMLAGGRKDVFIALALSPDSKLLATTRGFEDIILWDLEKLIKIEPPLIGHGHYVTSLAFSPDGKSLASGSRDRMRPVILWDLEKKKPEKILSKGHKNFVKCVRFSPNGRILATGGVDGAIILWDPSSGVPIGTPLDGHKGPVNCIEFSPDGRTLASGGSDNRIILWDVGAQIAIGPPLEIHSGTINSIAFNPDGKMMASGSDDGSIILWNVDIKSWMTIAKNTANRNLTYAEWKQFQRSGNDPLRFSATPLYQQKLLI